MGLVTLDDFGADPASVTGPLLDNKVNPLATEFNGNIENVNIKAGAAIAYSKLNLTTSVVNADISASAAIVASKIDLGTIAQDINEAKGADLASATTTTIWVTDGNFIHITGTTTITGFGTSPQAGAERTIVFDDALTLTHNATSLILPGAANITTAAGDRAIVRAETTANARVISYVKASGFPVLVGAATQAEMETATSTTTTVTPGRTQYHPGVAKAWGSFNGSGTPAYTVSRNMDSSITDNGTGDYTISFTTDFSSGDYVMAASAKSTAAGEGNIVNIKTGTTPAAGSVNIVTGFGSYTLVDATIINVAFFGDQA